MTCRHVAVLLFVRPPDGGVASGFEQMSLWVGVPNSTGSNGASPNPLPNPGTNGANALETTDYSYAYHAGSQSVATETRPSAISIDGGVAVTTSVRDSSNRLIRLYQSGATKLIDGNFEDRVVARFWTYDSGRVATETGPCFVNDTGVTSCSSGPLTTYAYFSSGEFNNGKLQSITRKASDTVNLVTTFGNYTALGEPGTTIDENGVETHFTYAGHNVTQRAVDLSDGGSVTWNYTWENEKLTSVQFPQSNFEAYCYRAVTTAGESCAAAPWTGRLQRVSKATSADGAGWSEAIVYEYWTDGSLKSETRYTPVGGTEEPRFKRTYAADAHKRQTLVTTGTSGAFTEARGYDKADNLAALGPAFNAPPSYCLEGGGALSKLCAQMGYDRAERLRQLDLYASSSSNPIRACIDYDQRGNVTRVTTGCGSSDTCSVDRAGSECGGEPELSHDYEADDFGNIVSVRLAGTSQPNSIWPTQTSEGERGVFRFEYDASGRLLRKQTQEHRGPITYHLAYSYDLLGRELSSSQCQPGTMGYDCTVLSLHDYDSVNAYDPPAGCPAPVATLGRVRRIFDPFITRWFQYDDFGRVTRELRLRTGDTSCVKSLPLSLTYSANGNLTGMVYGFGRAVTYSYGENADADRPVSVSAGFFTSGGVVQKTVVDSVKWEPYGGLRRYRIVFPSAENLFATVDYEAGAATAEPTTSWCESGAMGESLDKTGRLRRLRVYDDTTNIYRRTYKWEADQVRRISSCYLSDTTLVTEDYGQDTNHGYDGLQRLLGGVSPGFATNPGPMEERQYTYNARGSITKATVFPDGGAYLFNHNTAGDSRVDWLVSVGSDSWNSVAMTYDKDGQTAYLAGPTDSSNYYNSAISLDYHSPSLTPGPGSGTTYRTAGLLLSNFYYQYFSYWYDTENRRQAKVHPLNDWKDIYLYDEGHQLLESQGLRNYTNPAPYPTDEYVWLGGRPIAVFRATFTEEPQNGSLTHRSDDSANSECGRVGDPGGSEAKCGLYFLVTDHIRKPVLVLNQARLIAGVGEYEPYGAVNRAQKWWQTAHPYAAASSSTSSLTHSMKELGGMNVDMRVHFPMVDTDQTCRGSGGTVRDVVKLKDASAALLESIGGYRKGDVWSNWYAIPTDGAGMRPLTIEWAPQAGNCVEYSNCSEDCATGTREYSGVVMREVEYQRYQSGATPFFTPLRFAGHHWDSETDFYENWHRYYSTFRHGYLSPEPLLQSSSYVTMMAQSGMSVPTYAYALNNPLRYVDANGLSISTSIDRGPDQFGPGACQSPLEGGCTRLRLSDFKITNRCHQSPQIACQSAGGGNFSFDIELRFDLWLGFRSSPIANAPAYGPRASGTTRQHEGGHVTDFTDGVNGINTSIQSEGFSSMGECNAALNVFTDNLVRYLQGVQQASYDRRD